MICFSVPILSTLCYCGTESLVRIPGPVLKSAIPVNSTVVSALEFSWISRQSYIIVLMHSTSVRWLCSSRVHTTTSTLRYQTLESQLIQYYTLLPLLGLYMTYIKIPQVSTSINNVGCSWTTILASGLWPLSPYCPRTYTILSWPECFSKTFYLPGNERSAHTIGPMLVSNPLQGREGYLINGMPLTRVSDNHYHG